MSQPQIFFSKVAAFYDVKQFDWGKCENNDLFGPCYVFSILKVAPFEYKPKMFESSTFELVLKEESISDHKFQARTCMQARRSNAAAVDLFEFLR